MRTLPVQPVLAALALLGLLGFGWLAVAPNRLVSGTALSSFAALHFWVAAVALLLVAAVPISPRRPALACAALLAALGVALWASGAAAPPLLEGMPPAARVMAGPGFWLFLLTLLLMLTEAARPAAALRRTMPLVLLAMLAALWFGGALDALSLAVEYRARAPQLQDALLRHMLLSAAALALALVLFVPLGWWGFRASRAEAVLGTTLGLVQVVPALALFGALMPLLGALLRAVPGLREAGLETIGATPALIATALYAGLPLWRGIVVGLGAAPRDLVEAAEGMGMTSRRIDWELRVPLGLPIFLASLRVATVQCIGLMTLGGLVGAGGLGAIVFEGMAQFATDLILLGALPVILLALFVDGVLRLVEGRLARWRQ
ncbi:MAG: transporter permease [Rubritepida sp.]|nr:transporter permease [Rubritepida sp.]